MADNLFTRLLNAGRATNAIYVPPSPITKQQEFNDAPRLYQLLYDYYTNTGVYDEVRDAAKAAGLWYGPLDGLRNPALRITEFYVKHVWQGDLDKALPILGSPEVRTAVKQIWNWSDWNRQKIRFIRQLAIFGDGFLKIVHDENNNTVYFQQIDPRMVTHFERNHLGEVTKIRLDDKRIRYTDSFGSYQYYTYVEEWDSETQLMRIWELPSTNYDLNVDKPKEIHSFSEFNIDFVPFVWFYFKDVGEERGIGAYTLLKTKIDEINRATTRLHQMLFRYNKPFMSISSNGSDSMGRPLPPPNIKGRSGISTDALYIGDDDLLTLPGGATLNTTVPNIDFQSSLNIINAQLLEIERDAPELLYYRLTEMGDTSGRSIRYFMEPAIKSVIEVRTNAEEALVQADIMAMKIARNLGLITLSNDALNHKFDEREVITLQETDQAVIDQAEGQYAVYLKEIGIDPKVIAQKLGFKASDVIEVPTPVTDPTMPTNTPQPGSENTPANNKQTTNKRVVRDKQGNISRIIETVVK